MSVQRRVNWISQQRVDVPDVRAIESAGSNDFDQLIQSFVTGTSQGYVLRGFEILMTGAIGGAASGLQMLVDPGALFHIAASQSGTVLMTPAGTVPQQLNSATNTIVDGAFTPNAINYVGVDYERFIDSTTSAQVYIWDPTTNSETTKVAPRAQILRFRLKVSTTIWPTNILPIAVVTTDAGNNVVSITDARWGLFRLGTGGASPNPFYVYPWTAQTEGRTENPSTSTSNSVNPFHGGDKMLGTLKDWMNAIMSALQEIKGTTYWYGAGSAGSISNLREDLGNTVTVGKGTITHSAVTAGLVNWSDDIFLRVIGSNLAYKFAANPSSVDIQLADNEVAYVNLVRDVAVVPNLVFTNGSKIVQSVGSVSWTTPLQSGDWVRLASDTNANYYQIDTVDSLSQVTLILNFGGTSTGASGAKAVYAFGTYSVSASPSTNRDIFIVDRSLVPQNQDVWWFLLRSDNGGVVPRVYVRFIGQELEMGDTDEIDDGITRQLLTYIGSPSAATSRPLYTSAFTPGTPYLPQITDFTLGAASTISSNQYFFTNSSGDFHKYYVWFKKDGVGTDPAPAADRIGLLVAITTGQTNAQVATAVANVLTATGDFAAAPRANPNQFIVRSQNTSAGVTSPSSNVNVSSPFAVTTIQSGTGSGNNVIHDGDNLTLAIKELDQAIGAALNTNNPNYDEPLTVVTGAPANTNQITGPVSSGATLTLPNNSRAGSIAQLYTVGKGRLEVYLNGQYLTLNSASGNDWTEVGASNTNSSTIVINRGLAIGDIVEFRIVASGGGGGSGGGGVGPQGPPGPAGPPGADAAGGPVAISTKTSNYTVLLTDCALKANAVGGAITFTLPAASTASGRIFYFKKIDASANLMTIQAFGAELIDGFNTKSTSTPNVAFTLFCDGSTWSLF